MKLNDESQRLSAVEIRALLSSGNQYLHTGRLEGACRIIHDVMSVEPNNERALELQNEIVQHYVALLYAEDINKIIFHPDHFIVNPRDARAFFKATVSQINLETSSYCNRSCSFCPNSANNRRSAEAKTNCMSMSLFENIVNDLQSIDYSGTVSLSRYNEPLADPMLLERIRFCRAKLPKAFIIVFTNGDFLNRNRIQLLAEAGCSMLRISLYIKESEEYAYNFIQFNRDMGKEIDRFIKRLGLEYRLHRNIPGSCEATIFYEGEMDIFLVGRNYYDSRYRLSRGNCVNGAHAISQRTSPCFSSFYTMDIEYNGTVMPCCNLLSDYPNHQKYIVDTLIDKPGSLFKVYSGSTAVQWRRSLSNFSPKDAPCDKCGLVIVKECAETRAIVKRCTSLL
jgi:hypothetical protein